MTKSEMDRAEAQIWLKTVIARAWRRRRKLTTKVVCGLSCYVETDLDFKSNGTIDDRPVKCGVDDCCLRQQFIARPGDVSKLKAACDTQPDKAEILKRRSALRHLDRTPKRPFDEKQCRALGDAVFVFQANLTDHTLLAESLGKSVAAPTSNQTDAAKSAW